MVRLDNEERPEAAVFEKPSSVLFARAGKFGRQWRLEIRRQFRELNCESKNALFRFEKRRRQRRLPFRNVDREAAQ